MSDRPRHDGATPPKSDPGWAFLVTLAVITLIGPLAIHAFLPVLPAISTVFGVSKATAGLSFSAALVVMAVATLVYGSLSDRYGRRPVLLGGLCLFVIGGAISAFTQSIEAFIAGRMLQALGAGCSITLARAVARDAYGTDVLVKVIAYLTMAYTLGPMISPYISGFLLDHLGWRSVFWFMTISGMLILITSALVLVETLPKHARHHVGASYLGDYQRLFSHLRFSGYVFQSGFSSGCFYTLASASAFIMTDYLGRSASEFGMYFGLFPLGFFFGNLVSSRLTQKVHLDTMVLSGALMNFLAIMGQSWVILAGHVSPLVIFIPGVLITFGQGLALPNATTGAMRVIPNLSGTASGVGVFCQTLLGAFFAQIYAIISDGTPAAMIPVIGFCSTVTLIAGSIPFLLTRRERRQP